MRGLSRLVLFAVAAFIATPFASAQTYRVNNNCPTAIDLFIGEASQGSLARGASLTRTGLGTSAGFFYTTTNGGRVNGQLVAARAGFYFEPQYWYYYLVRDQNSGYFNTGIKITPSVSESGGYCRPAECSSGSCTTAYTTPPVFHGGPPPPDSPPFNPPTYQCKVEPSSITFDIQFCPSGDWPTEAGAQVFHNFTPNKCVDVRGNNLQNGTPVQIYDCNGTGAQRWILNSVGSTKLRVAGSNFCLDAGSNPGNGVQLKLWQCYDNLPAQAWIATQDTRIVLAGTALCIDLPSGNTANGQVLQTWTCGDGNTNQIFGIQA